ncbi:phosphatidylinositol alpha-1,6-mannosyltransferase [Ectothiorhodospira magna]|uniref:Phosphatidylinositol alpha-1,6-mannosyltransferase n=1 Tax=Ectothiorhodospira magna TaxID=867345 RepID=A0A1H8ZB08_9GAMM|nr:glycosyltransferase family 4 protein [Ectothiorhodospira magna]SEP61563.1 phosphatidylinositol alpha-1,6-mannosyltransferase [Ectothiorhodospira magna]
MNRKILLVTRNLPPLTGGMERLNWHLAQELAQEFAVAISGPHGSQQRAPVGTQALKTFASAPLYRFMLESLVTTLSNTRHFRPDLLIAGSGVTAPHVWLGSRLCSARTAVYLHGLDLIASHPLYRAFFLPCIQRMDLALTNSHHTAQLARNVGIDPRRIKVLHPGVTLPDVTSRYDTAAFLQSINAVGRTILLSVGRLTARKGLLEFVRHALPAIVSVRPDVLLVIIGAEATETLGARRANRLEAIRREAEDMGLGKHLRFLGKVDEEMLMQAYRSSALHIFPVLNLPGDVEGFGMVAIEAAAHGLPTVAFASGGVPDAVADGVSGRLVPTGDYAAFSKTVIDLLSDSQTEITPERCREFSSRFAWERFGAKTREVCGHLLAECG